MSAGIADQNTPRKIRTTVSHAYNPIAWLEVSGDVLAHFYDKASGIAPE
jgi:hypothetical protein